jgi:hypothetical protein
MFSLIRLFSPTQDLVLRNVIRIFAFGGRFRGYGRGVGPFHTGCSDGQRFFPVTR